MIAIAIPSNGYQSPHSFVITFVVQHLPWTHMMYCLLPTLPFQYITDNLDIYVKVLKQLMMSYRRETLIGAVGLVIGLELTVSYLLVK